MLLRHSLGITVSRFSLVYKVLLFAFVVALIFGSIALSSAYAIVKPIFAGVENMQFFQHLGDAFKAFFSGQMQDSPAFEIVGNDFEKIQNIFAENRHNVIGAVCLLIVFYFVAKFLFAISYYPTSDVINNFMNSNSKYGFTANLIANLKKSTAYSLVDTLISVPYTALIACAIYGVGWVLGKFSVLLAISADLLIVMVMLALKSSVLALWLPTYINEDLGVFKSLAKAVKGNKHTFLHNFGMYVIVNFIGYIFFVICGIFTFGLGSLVALSIINVLGLSIRMVLYYRKAELRYYVDEDTIVDSKQVVKAKY